MIKPVKEWKSDFHKTRREKIATAINSSTAVFKLDYKFPFEEGKQSDWNCTLMTIINQANKYFEGTTLIVSCEANAILGDLPYYEPIIDSDISINQTFYKSATLGNFDVMVDVNLPPPYIIIVKDDFFTVENPNCVIIYIQNLPSF